MKSLKATSKYIFILLLVLCSLSCGKNCDYIDLSGHWEVRVNNLSSKVKIPGSLAENRIGVRVKDSTVRHLSEEYHYEGPAFYTKEVEVPESWAGRPVELFIERTKCSVLSVDDSLAGQQSSVSAPHRYIIDHVSPGKHNLELKIDNTKSLLPVGGSHACSEHTQTNWNGILGRVYLRCLEEIDVMSLKVASETDGHCSLTVGLINNAQEPNYGKIRLKVYNASGKRCFSEKYRVKIAPEDDSLVVEFDVDRPELWDEYSPEVYRLVVESSFGWYSETTFGFREFVSEDGRLKSNGRTVFLRGKHEGGVFPLTGYPSMKKSDWLAYFTTVKEYGINHVRFHSWTPPSAAFEAADEKGIFLQVELPLWGKYKTGDTALVNYMKDEGERILETYGNHPSFVMLALGNELSGDVSEMESVVNFLRDIDNRHLYSMGSNNFYWDSRTYDCEDFFVSMRNGMAKADCSTDLRGSFSFANAEGGGIVNNTFPDTRRNFSSAIKGIDKPVIGHETGQYQVYPDFKEMPEYTGVLKPYNFAVIRKRLEEKGIFGKSEDFLKASGALSVLCYREEIEMALRTEGMDGFQLLDLQDYPGQGTALVGILNAFMESKGLVSTEQWRQFCNDIVPLARFPRYCWTSCDTLSVDIDIAHYGKSDMKEHTIFCRLMAGDRVLYERSFVRNIVQGHLNKVASVTIPLSGYHLGNTELSLCVDIEGTPYKNRWNLWVYDGNGKVCDGLIGKVRVTRDSKVFEKCLEKNEKVLYIPRFEDIEESSVSGLFISDFWNYASFRKTAQKMGKEPSPGTFGLLIDSNHDIFREFPTGTHTDWQWWNIIHHSRPMVLDGRDDYVPIVQVIDNWDRNHELGLIYEIKGHDALVCASDLFKCKDEPEVKALFKSLVDYLDAE